MAAARALAASRSPLLSESFELRAASILTALASSVRLVELQDRGVWSGERGVVISTHMVVTAEPTAV